jgi:hypothetical protein
MRERKAWCPACYQEAEDTNHEQYDQLLWVVQDATCCLAHGCRLVAACPHCGKSNPHLGWKNRAGYCSSCYEWLGSLDVDRSVVTAWDRWRTEQIGRLLAAGGCGARANQPQKQRITETLRTLAAARGIKKTGKLAKFLGFRREGVVDWFYGKVVPSFSSLLVICGKFGIGLLDFLNTDLEVLAGTPSDLTIPAPPERVYRRRPKSELEAVLYDALRNADPSDSLRTICERAGWSRSGGHASCPELAQKIAARRREHFSGRVRIKKQKVFEEVCELIQQMKKQGLNLAPVVIGRLLRKPGVLRAKWGREAFVEALKAEGLDATWPIVAPISALKDTRFRSSSPKTG